MRRLVEAGVLHISSEILPVNAELTWIVRYSELAGEKPRKIRTKFNPFNTGREIGQAALDLLRSPRRFAALKHVELCRVDILRIDSLRSSEEGEPGGPAAGRSPPTFRQ